MIIGLLLRILSTLQTMLARQAENHKAVMSRLAAIDFTIVLHGEKLAAILNALTSTTDIVLTEQEISDLREKVRRIRQSIGSFNP